MGDNVPLAYNEAEKWASEAVSSSLPQSLPANKNLRLLGGTSRTGSQQRACLFYVGDFLTITQTEA